MRPSQYLFYSADFQLRGTTPTTTTCYNRNEAFEIAPRGIYSDLLGFHELSFSPYYLCIWATIS